MPNLPTEIAGQSVEAVLANAGGSNVLIPEGIYKAMAVEGTLKDTEKGGVMLVLKFVITEGQHANVEIVDRLNIVNSNTKTQKIALEGLARIAKAVGLEKTPQNSDALLRKPLLIQVKTEKGKPAEGKFDNEGKQIVYPDKSVIESKGYKPLPTGTSAPAAAPVTAGAMPWDAA
jgi:hypothetical protein